MTDVRASLAERLATVQPHVGLPYLPDNFRDHLAALQTADDVRQAAMTSASPLWWFIGPIAYALFDKEGHQLADTALRQTVAVLPPPFAVDVPHAMDEIAALGCEVTAREVEFSPRLVALLYGGYPWYEAYFRACAHCALFGRAATVLDIRLPATMTPAQFNREKERIRTLLSPEIRITIDGLPFPGLIRPIHSPEAIEVARHVRATQL